MKHQSNLFEQKEEKKMMQIQKHSLDHQVIVIREFKIVMIRIIRKCLANWMDRVQEIQGNQRCTWCVLVWIFLRDIVKTYFYSCDKVFSISKHTNTTWKTSSSLHPLIVVNGHTYLNAWMFIVVTREVNVSQSKWRCIYESLFFNKWYKLFSLLQQ